MAQPRHGDGLAREAMARFGRTLQVGMHHLERDEPVQARVAGAIDRGHAAMADLIDDFVLLDRLEHRTRSAENVWTCLCPDRVSFRS
jgi:hypothetical protein